LGVASKSHLKETVETRTVFFTFGLGSNLRCLQNVDTNTNMTLTLDKSVIQLSTSVRDTKPQVDAKSNYQPILASVLRGFSHEH
jgi:hypothetical protein